MKALLPILLASLLALALPARAQDFFGPPAPGGAPAAIPTLPDPPFESPADLNPLAMIGRAADALPGAPSRGAGGGFSTGVSIMLVLTVIALVPSIMLMTTCFVRMLIVLSMLRQALGTQSLPPSQVIIALTLFMTFVVMAPTVDRIRDEAVVPWQQGRITDYDELWDRARQPLRDFMFAQIDATGNWSSVYMMLNYRGIDTSDPARLTRADVDMVSLVPAYMLSELKVAFLMGFRIYLPFLVIDMVVASLLISMSMMMLPPVLISLPFKILLFVLVDGWTLVVGSLMTSFSVPEPHDLAAAIDGLLPALAVLVHARPGA
jgi:flagellar biosynthetic protein FliP